MTIKAFSYLRVSGKGQIMGGGFDRQREAVHKYARKNSIEIAKEFRDEGVSGTKELNDREGLAALLDRLESNGVKIVLIETANRLARDLAVSEVILSQFRDIGARVLTADNGTDLTRGDSSDPTSKLIRQILGIVSEFDKDVTVLKLKAARERIRRKSGRCEGRKPFGHNDSEREAMDRLKGLTRKPRNGQRRSFESIAKIMNREGYKSRSGKPWTGKMIRSLCSLHFKVALR